MTKVQVHGVARSLTPGRGRGPFPTPDLLKIVIPFSFRPSILTACLPAGRIPAKRDESTAYYCSALELDLPLRGGL